MLRTLPIKRKNDLTLRFAGIAFFTLLTIVSARISLEIGQPVPFTMQVFAVLFSGMILGARDGALSQVAYVALIVAGMPVDARGLGSAALFGPTGGYLIGFIVAAAVAGYLVERSGARLLERWLAGVAGIAVIYFFGVVHLSLFTGRDLAQAWSGGAAPFVAFDLIKALIAAALVEGGRFYLQSQDKKEKHKNQAE